MLPAADHMSHLAYPSLKVWTRYHRLDNGHRLLSNHSVEGSPGLDGVGKEIKSHLRYKWKCLESSQRATSQNSNPPKHSGGVTGRCHWKCGLGVGGGSDGKESACNTGHQGSIPGLGRSPGEGHGNPLQYICLENPMDREETGGLQSIGLQNVGHN